MAVIHMSTVSASRTLSKSSSSLFLYIIKKHLSTAADLETPRTENWYLVLQVVPGHIHKLMVQSITDTNLSFISK